MTEHYHNYMGHNLYGPEHVEAKTKCGQRCPPTNIKTDALINTCERERKEEKKSAAVPIGPKGTSLQAGDPESQLWSQLSNLSVRDIFLKQLLSAPST
ncbi:hypothetical protein PO909_009511 [Leuciscus waleckii]